MNVKLLKLQAKLKSRLNEAVKISEKNTIRNSSGQVVINKDDEWRIINEWNDIYDKK